MIATSQASKEVQLDRINNKINFLNSEINRTINQMNNIYLEIDNEAESTSVYNGISIGNLNIKRREYDDKKNHLMSCITSLETQINKIPVQEEDYSQEFIENFLNEVKEIEKNRKEEDVYGEVAIASNTSSSYIKTKSGVIVPRGKEPKMLKASATGYACRAETFCKLLLRVINEYQTIYMYGSNGDRPTQTLLNSLKNQYPRYYGSKQVAAIKATFGKNYWAFDCSGLLRAVLWGWCGDDSKPHGGSCLGSGSVVPWHDSSAMIASCPHDPKDTHYEHRNLGGSCIFTNNIVPGECVWTSGHIGAYIGNGQCAESTPHVGWKNGAQVTILANISSASGNRREWKRHGKLPYIDYSNTMTDNLGNGWIAGPGNGGMSTGSGGIAQYGYINGLNVTDMYESDNYYGYGQKTEFIERTESASVVRLVVSQSTTVSNLAKSLSMTTTNLLNLNPSLKSSSSSSSSAASSKASSSSVINSGTTIYVPASAYTAAKEKATSSYNTASVQIEQLNKLLSVIKGDISLASYVTSMSTLTSETTEEPVTSVNKMLTSSSSSATSSSTKATSSSTSKNYATSSSDGQTNSEKMYEYKGWTRVYDTSPYKDYAKARIIIVKDGKTRVIKTVISPTGYSESYSNSINLQQTTGGWFMARHGENPVNLTITGVMLDTDTNPEKHAFIKEWKDYLIDKQGTRTGLFYNKSSVKIQLEGIRYEGTINSISFTKDANTPSLYNFTLNFSCVNYKITRSISGAMKRLGKKGSTSSNYKSSSKSKSSSSSSFNKTKTIGDTLYKTMNNK